MPGQDAGSHIIDMVWSYRSPILVGRKAYFGEFFPRSPLTYSIVRLCNSGSSKVVRQSNQCAPHELAHQKETAQTEPKFIVLLWELKLPTACG
jgi:hypothetical protein